MQEICARPQLVLSALALASVMAAAPVRVTAQQPLSLVEAARIALESHPAVDGAAAGQSQAEQGVRAARAGLQPKLSYAESYIRSNNPVFVFGSLLNQRRFGPANFEIDRLNNPPSLQNFQSLVTVEQTVFDAQRTKRAIQAARIETQLAREGRRELESQIVLGVVRTYFGVAMSAERVAVAEKAVQSAEADLRLAEDLAEAGMATRADALSVQVHLSAMREELIRARSDADTAQAALNDALGLDLSLVHELTTELAPAPETIDGLGALLEQAVGSRPDLRSALLEADLADTRAREARSMLWPQFIAQGAFEADRQRPFDRGGGNWLAGFSMRWDVWDGAEKRARVKAAEFGKVQADARQRQAASAAALEVRQARAEAVSADERLKVAAASVEHAEEALRIITNRYEAGLEGIAALLRSEIDLLSASLRRLAATYEQRVSRAAMQHVAGGLSPDSEVLR